MRNPNRTIDKTQLSADQADVRVIRHRDLVSHALRWAHIAKWLQNKYTDAVILDAGCGQELPMAKMLYSNRIIPKQYVGVDVNRGGIPEMIVGKKIPLRVWWETDLCQLEGADVSHADGSLPNVFVSLEVFEHMLPKHGRQFLKHAISITSDDCHYFISTPCWDMVNAAENHLSEVKAYALGALLEDLGYKIEGFWGTFASQKDYVPIMEEKFPGIRKIFDGLSEYYDSTVISFLLAPLFPLQSRNCLWHLTKQSNFANAYQRKFPPLSEVPGPWSQHPNWKELAG